MSDEPAKRFEFNEHLSGMRSLGFGITKDSMSPGVKCDHYIYMSLWRYELSIVFWRKMR